MLVKRYIGKYKPAIAEGYEQTLYRLEITNRNVYQFIPVFAKFGAVMVNFSNTQKSVTLNKIINALHSKSYLIP